MEGHKEGVEAGWGGGGDAYAAIFLPNSEMFYKFYCDLDTEVKITKTLSTFFTLLTMNQY